MAAVGGFDDKVVVCKPIEPRCWLLRVNKDAAPLQEDQVVAGWSRVREQIVPYVAFWAEVRKIIDTTNAIESLEALSKVFAA